MTPSEHETGRPQSEPSSRLSGELTSSDLPEITAANSSSFPGVRKASSVSKNHLLLTADPSSISRSRSPSHFRSQSHGRSSVSSRPPFTLTSVNYDNEAYRQLIIRSFAPRVAVFASSDTEEFVRKKGFKDGLYSLLRPYGERLQGKIVIRDSVGGNRGWDDFGIRIVDSEALQENNAHRAGIDTEDQNARTLVNGSERFSEHIRSSHSNEMGMAIDRVLDEHLRTTGAALGGQGKQLPGFERTSYAPRTELSPLYQIYLRKLLSNSSLVPYETFSHPVACLIAVSSRHSAPIEALRQLYSNTVHGSEKIPAWMATEYLRYYVLIHDEENDDIVKSTALFDLMKRHFGLHCHMLRLRQSQCDQNDDDSTRFPACEWLSAEEDFEKGRMGGRPDCIFFHHLNQN